LSWQCEPVCVDSSDLILKCQSTRLTISLLSATRCPRLILYISCLRPRISHVSDLFWWETISQDYNLGPRDAYCQKITYLIPPKSLRILSLTCLQKLLFWCPSPSPPIFLLFVFEIGSHLCSPHWPRTHDLLASASFVARDYRCAPPCPASLLFLTVVLDILLKKFFILFICAYNVWVISPHFPRPLPLPLIPSLPGRNYSALISSFVEERV
jgi:hypothetical protein